MSSATAVRKFAAFLSLSLRLSAVSRELVEYRSCSFAFRVCVCVSVALAVFNAAAAGRWPLDSRRRRSPTVERVIETDAKRKKATKNVFDNRSRKPWPFPGRWRRRSRRRRNNGQRKNRWLGRSGDDGKRAVGSEFRIAATADRWRWRPRPEKRIETLHALSLSVPERPKSVEMRQKCIRQRDSASGSSDEIGDWRVARLVDERLSPSPEATPLLLPFTASAAADLAERHENAPELDSLSVSLSVCLAGWRGHTTLACVNETSATVLIEAESIFCVCVPLCHSASSA